ncbi:MAG TPA: bifunctional glycosyltransferase family 2/GtrA family protein [Alphaproteobacteria bacterium]|nr:bifunctional glycosyltransferase family 2/GtrA family protein [Alphaproteobacteria bacterium]
MTPVFLIPAYNPDRSLLDIARSLAARSGAPVVVVDDGSTGASRGVLDELRGIAGVTLLSHDENRGKGAALKTGIGHALRAHPGAPGVVTLDADGQHSVDDALRVADRLRAKPHALVIGMRDFHGRVPLRSRIGNALTRQVFGALVGLRLRDTQSGLRGIPLGFGRRLLALPANGYEFELDMLILAKEIGLDVGELPIATIYVAGNRSSHFNPILDSVRIYLSLFRYVLASVITAVLDNLIFIAVFALGMPLLPAQAVGRAGAFGANYLLVKRTVFHSDQRHRKALPRYVTLVVVSGIISYGMIVFLNHRLDMPVIAAKITAEGILYFANFLVQREFIFRKRRQYNG